MKKVLFLLVIQLSCYAAWAQVADTDSLKNGLSNPNKLNDINMASVINLPPISVFMDAANSYANVKQFDEMRKEAEISLAISKKQWLNYLRIQGSYQYGTGTDYQAITDLITPEIARSSVKSQSWYNAGVTLAIPLEDLFTRRNKNNIARSKVNQSEYAMQTILEERKLLILQSYNEVIKNIALLKVNAESVALYDAQMMISERDFSLGRIDIISLSLERARRTEATIKYETSRAALHNAVTILELLTNIKIIKE